MLFGLINPKRRINVRGLSSSSYKIRVDKAKKADQANEGDRITKSDGVVTIAGHVDEGKVDSYVVDGEAEVLEGNVQIETEEVLESRWDGALFLGVIILALGFSVKVAMGN